MTTKAPKTVAEFRAQLDAAKPIAMANFKRDWGTSDVQAVVRALRQTIPNSTSPSDAVKKAHAIINR